MGRKDVIQPKPVITAGDMSGDITSLFSDCRYQDNVCYQVRWSGTSPVGSIVVEVTNQDPASLLVSPTWSALDFGSTISVSGNTGNHFININQNPGAWIRMRYVHVSGSGSLDSVVVVKQVGG